MSLPTTNYATATLVNPTAALTDFTLMVDLSRMPAAWWASVNTTDGTRGRVAKDDGTEMAVDWIDFVDEASPGWLRGKWSGTLATSGVQKVRIYPPNLDNAAVLPAGTFGSNNVYPSSMRRYHAQGGAVNRVFGGSPDGVLQNSPTTVAGKIGNATRYDGVNQATMMTASLSASTSCAVFIWAKIKTLKAAGYVYTGGVPLNRLYLFGGDPFTITAGAGASVSTGDTLTADQWHFLSVRLSGGRVLAAADDNAESDTNLNGTVGTGAANGEAIGRFPTNTTSYLDMDAQSLMVFDADPGLPWRNQEYAQTNDQAEFWGTWTDNPVASGRRRAMVVP